jgi:hypothetical protein
LIYFIIETLLDGEPIIKIPPKTIQLSTIDFTKEERAFYLRLEENSRQTLKVVTSLHLELSSIFIPYSINKKSVVFPIPSVVLHDINMF